MKESLTLELPESIEKKLVISRRYFLKVHRRNFMKFMKRKDKIFYSWILSKKKKNLWKYTVVTLQRYFMKFMNKRLGFLLYYKLFSIFFYWLIQISYFHCRHFLMIKLILRALDISFSFFFFRTKIISLVNFISVLNYSLKLRVFLPRFTFYIFYFSLVCIKYFVQPNFNCAWFFQDIQWIRVIPRHFFFSIPDLLKLPILEFQKTAV